MTYKEILTVIQETGQKILCARTDCLIEVENASYGESIVFYFEDGKLKKIYS